MIVNNNPTKKRATFTRLSLEQRQEVRELLGKGIRPEVLAVQFNVHFNTIGNIRKEAEELGQPLDQTAP